VIGYTDTLLEHFQNPRNVGKIPDADGIGLIGDPKCGDFLRVYIKVDEHERLAEVKFECFGCPAAIACASVMTELAQGKFLDEAEELTDERIAEALGGLPEVKFHCSNLGAEALDNAIWDYAVKATRREVEDRQVARSAGTEAPRPP